MSTPLEQKVEQLSRQMYVSYSLFNRLSFVLISIRSHVLRALPDAASAAESELEELASKKAFAPSKSHDSAPSKNQDSAWAEKFSPLEDKVEQMQAQLYVSYFILQEKIFSSY